jgi:NAD(P)-dependent dehydrogenase (short-subunit alcohol dehydrogenase family)
MTVDGKVALVTGAGSAIGRAVALGLAENGWAVVLAGRRADKLEETASLAHQDARTLIIPTDVSDAAVEDPEETGPVALGPIVVGAITDAMGSLSFALNVSAAMLALGAVLSAFQKKVVPNI